MVLCDATNARERIDVVFRQSDAALVAMYLIQLKNRARFESLRQPQARSAIEIDRTLVEFVELIVPIRSESLALCQNGARVSSG